MRVLKENRLVQFSLVALAIMVTFEVVITATSGAMLNSMMADHIMMMPSPSDQANIREDIDNFRWFNTGILAASFMALYGVLVLIVWRGSGTFTKERSRMGIFSAELERQLQEHIDEAAVIDEIARIITSTLDIDEVYEKFALEMKKLVDFDRVAINTINRTDQTFTVRYVYGSIGPIRSVGTPISLENTQVGEVVKTANTSRRSDIASELRFGLDAEWVAMGLKSGIMVPLISKGEVVGTFGLRSRQSEAYGPHKQAILERLAKQIAPAVENASLFEQVQTGVQEKALTDNLAQIITSTLNIDEVYERFGQNLKRLVDFDRVIVNSINPATGTRTLKYVYGEQGSTNVIGSVSPLEGTQNQQVLMTRRTLIRSDFASHQEFPSDLATAKMGLRSSVMVPLISQGKVVGTLGLRSREVNAYGEREQAILERLAEKIAPALENALLYEQIVQDQEEKVVADKVAQIITSTLNIDEVCEEFTREMKNLVEIDQASICIVDPKAGTYTLKYLFGQPLPGREVGMALPLADTQTEYVFRTGQTLVRGDISSQSRFPHDSEHQELALRSSIALPLVSEGRIIGSWVLRSRAVTAYGEREQAILERLAKQIAPAVENARLYEQIVQSQEELRKLSQAVEQSPSGVMITDLKGTIQYVNPRFSLTTGYTLEEVVGENPRIFKSGETPPEVHQELWEHLTAGKEWQGRCLNRKKNGELYWAEQRISPIRDSLGTTAHFLSVEEDITEKKHLEEQFSQAQKMESIGQLAGGVAHDFNNLLTVITGYTGMLLSKSPIESESADQLREISKAAELGSQLTNQLLGFSRLQVIKPKTLDVSAAVMNSYGMLRRVIGENIELVMSPAEGLPAIFMDPTQLDQIVMNLVINAGDAMPEGGTLTVTASHNQGALSAASIGDCVVLSVSDTGVGMSEEVKAHLFEPFYTTKEMGKGTGLGLATCYGIVEQNGGHIEVDSKLGQGSTFKVYLPVTEERDKSGIDGDSTSASNSIARTETILLVEDEPQVRAMEAILLADQGYAVLQAADGEEALRVCQANQDQEIQLLLTDMVMPRMSGVELITELSRSRPETKFLVVSGYAKSAMERSVVTRGDVHFMQKPFKPTELANTVREILDGVPEPAV